MASQQVVDTVRQVKKKPSNPKRAIEGWHLKKAEKMNKNFMYKDLKKSHCYDCDFSGSNFDFASFRGAHFKSCNFYGASFKGTEFVGSNLKKCRFKKARFEETIFEGVNLEDTDFAGSVFKNTIFVGCDLSKAKNLNKISVNIKVYDTFPEINLSEELEEALREAMMNKHIEKARVLDTKEGKINTISVQRLLEQFDEKTLIKGLKLMRNKIANDFCTLSYLTKFLAKHEAEGLI